MSSAINDNLNVLQSVTLHQIWRWWSFSDRYNGISLFFFFLVVRLFLNKLRTLIPVKPMNYVLYVGIRNLKVMSSWLQMKCAFFFCYVSDTGTHLEQCILSDKRENRMAKKKKKKKTEYDHANCHEDKPGQQSFKTEKKKKIADSECWIIWRERIARQKCSKRTSQK